MRTIRSCVHLVLTANFPYSLLPLLSVASPAIWDYVVVVSLATGHRL